MQPVEGTATIRLFHIGDNVVKKKIIRPVVVPPGCSRVIVRLDEAGIGTFRREHMLQADLQDQSGAIVARTSTLAQIERHVAFPAARLSMRIDRGDLVISTDKYAHSIALHGNDKGDEFGWLFGDNYFDLLPGEEKVVRILGRHNAGTVTARPWYSPHQTTIVWDRHF
jgi:hypothetical protein